MNMAVNADLVQLERMNEKWPDRFVEYTTQLEGLRQVDPTAIPGFGDKLLNVSAERIAAEAKELLGGQ